MSLPAIVNFKDFLTFDYSVFYASNYTGGGFLKYFFHPAVPLLSVYFYLAFSKPFINMLSGRGNGKDASDNASTTSAGSTTSSAGLKLFIFAHNLFLAVYSAWTCYYSWSAVMTYVNSHRGPNGEFWPGVWSTICAPKEELWFGELNMIFWIAHFYVSKYYEFIDTWILLWDGKTPIFLQTFHHAGIAILMWMLTVTYASPVVIVVCFNSFIHTIMYVYYALSTLDKNKYAKLRAALTPLKPYVTNMQLLQFIIGIGITVKAHFIEGCVNDAQRIALLLMQLYCFALIVLFGQFYYKTYIKKGPKGEKKTK